jgi:hypothetical protein
MKFRPALATLMLLSVFALSACWRIPLTPSHPIPAGTMVFRFTGKVMGPVELMIDGTRIPVEQLPKGATVLKVQGLSTGKHRYFLTSQRETFSPDSGELDFPADKGCYQVTLMQKVDSVLYGKPDPLPPAEGLPGVTATLQN